MQLKECYDGISRLSASHDVDSLQVVEEVSRLRDQWRPEKIKFVLLAESHVRTSQEDFANHWHVPNTECGGRFVRFVYCLANGEQALVPSSSRNPGTSQFWKIFYSCLNRVSRNADFKPILRSTPFIPRISNKIRLLSGLKSAGIWLTDASIVSVNHLKDPNIRKRVLQYSWDNYTWPIIASIRPTLRHVIVIGSLVGKVVKNQLESFHIANSHVPQPQAHLPMPGYFPFYKTFYEICSCLRE